MAPGILEKSIPFIAVFIAAAFAFAGIVAAMRAPRNCIEKVAFSRAKTEFCVEVARNAVTRAKGLSGRAELQPNKGMLFMFERERSNLSFHMGGMRFPLDILFFNSKKEVIYIAENLPACPNFLGCTIITQKVSTQYVLEINAGLAQKYGIRVGDPADFTTANIKNENVVPGADPPLEDKITE